MQWFVFTQTHLVVLAQILVAALLGAAIGVERELTAQPAGLRTHMLVSLGAALFTLAGTHFGDNSPTRIAAQVVTGIGFLGGGAILREGANVRGLTTAASLWVTAAVGLAVGLQSWFAAVVTTVVALAVLWLIRLIERKALPSRRVVDIRLTLEKGAALDEVEREVLHALPQARVTRLSYSETGQAIELQAKPEHGISMSTIGETLHGVAGVVGIDISH
jgi:putative Mg2+ transporter-C (MgtC) family protein